MHEYPEITHSEHHHNYTMDFDMSLKQQDYVILFYTLIIVFTFLFFVQSFVIFYYCYKNCENTPCKRLTRIDGIKLEMGQLTHNLEEEEQQTLE